MSEEKKYLEKRYNPEKNVLIAAQERISYIFDEFDSINVSISGGKDSEVLAVLALKEAHKRGRKIGIFFLDEEVVYSNTIKMVEYIMGLYPENTTRYWLQLPFHLTNSTSFKDGQIICWEQKMKPKWMHLRHKENILHKTWSHETIVRDKNKGFGFYDVMFNFEKSFENTAFLVGLRADESLNRYRAMIKNPGYKDVYWSTKRSGDKNYTFYPIYDWGIHDVFKYINDEKLKYHPFYDFAYKKNKPVGEIRVSSLTHEKSFKSICDLPEFEFDTYEKLLARVEGISVAQETAKNAVMFKAQKLPKAYKTWKDYRDFLLKTYPKKEDLKIFKKRFSKHKENEYVARQQVKQLILGDIENNFPIDNKEDPIQERIKYWKSIL